LDDILDRIAKRFAKDPEDVPPPRMIVESSVRTYG
jgi:hypothetical protein